MIDLRKHITHDIVEYLRRQLDSADMDLVDKEEHDRTQISKCLMLFVQYVEQNADKNDRGPSDSRMLASILEGINTLADIVVSKDTFVANLQAVNASVAQLAEKSNAQDQLIEQLISVAKDAISKGVSGVAVPEDFATEQTILDGIQSQVASIGTSGSVASSDLNTAISSISGVVATAPTATGTASTPVAVDPSATPIVTTTPPPVDSSTISASVVTTQPAT